MDGIPAIELNDGSILPIKSEAPTHVTFIEKMKIDVNDIKSGGWIGNGIYNASERSDTIRYVERKKAEQRAEEKRKQTYRGSHQIDIKDSKQIYSLNINNIVEKVKKKYGGLSSHDYTDLAKLKKVIGNPNAEIKIYRAAPVNELNNGDWVTTNRDYAMTIKNQNGGKVYGYTVKASDLYYPNNIEDLPSLALFSAFQYNKTEIQQQYSLSEDKGMLDTDNLTKQQKEELGKYFRYGQLKIQKLTAQEKIEIRNIGYENFISDGSVWKIKENGRAENITAKSIPTEKPIITNTKPTSIVDKIYEELKYKDDMTNQEIDELIYENIPKKLSDVEYEKLFDDTREKIAKKLIEKGYTYYGGGYNLEKALYEVHNKITNYLDEKGIDYEVSRSQNAGLFNSIYLNNGRRIANHYNGSNQYGFTDFKYSNRELVDNWKNIVDELIGTKNNTQYSLSEDAKNKNKVSNIAKEADKIIGFGTRRDKNKFKKIISKYIAMTREQLMTPETFNELGEDLKIFAQIEVKYKNEEIMNAKRVVRKTRIKVTDYIKRNITDYNDFRKQNFGKLLLSNDGQPVDSVYEELSSEFPHIFGPEIINEADMIYRLSDFMNEDIVQTDFFTIDQDTMDEFVSRTYNMLIDKTKKPKLREKDIAFTNEEDGEQTISDVINGLDELLNEIIVEKPNRFHTKKGKPDNVRTFPISARDSSLIDDLIKKDIPDMVYSKYSDKKAVEISKQRIKDVGYENLLTTVETKFQNGERITKQDISDMTMLVQQAQAKGDTAKVVELIAEIAIAGTELGQAVQAMSLIGKLTPEGQLVMIQKQVQRENKLIEIKNKTPMTEEQVAKKVDRRAKRKAIREVLGDEITPEQKLTKVEEQLISYLEQADGMQSEQELINNISFYLEQKLKMDNAKEVATQMVEKYLGSIENVKKESKSKELTLNKYLEKVDNNAKKDAVKQAMDFYKSKIQKDGFIKQIKEQIKMEEKIIKEVENLLEVKSTVPTKKKDGLAIVKQKLSDMGADAQQDTINKIAKYISNKLGLSEEESIGMAKKIMNRYMEQLRQVKLEDIKKATKIDISEENAQRILNSKNPKELEDNVSKALIDIADQIPITFGDKIRSWRYMAMLANPRTHIRNIAANVIMEPVRGAKNFIGAAIEDIVNPVERTKTLRPVSQEIKDFAKQDIKDVRSRLDNDKYDMKSTLNKYKRAFDNNWLNVVSQFNSGLLKMEDTIFKDAAYINSLSKYLTANNYTVEFLNSGTPQAIEALEKARSYAIQQALEATFQQYNALAVLMNRAENAKTGNAALDAGIKIGVGAIMPFKKTPMNIAVTAIEYSPLGIARAMTTDAIKLKKGQINGSQYIENLSKGLTGSSILALGLFMASLGLIKASGEDEDKEEDFEKLQGKQIYSIEIGGKSYTLDWASPTAIPFFLGAEIYFASQNDKAVNAGQLFENVQGMLDPLTQMSLLQGLNSTMQNYGDNWLGGFISNTTQNYTSQFVPTVLGQVARTIDPVRRNTTASKDAKLGKNLQTFINKQVAKIPYASKTLPSYVDAYGREDSKNTLDAAIQNFISPSYIKDIKSTPVDKEISRLYKKNGETKILPNVPSYNYTLNGETINLTPKQYETRAKKDGQTAYNTLSALFNSNYYKGLPDTSGNSYDMTKEKMIQKVYDYANLVGKVSVMKKSDEKTKIERQIRLTENKFANLFNLRR